jgi:hypothetical protein
MTESANRDLTTARLSTLVTQRHKCLVQLRDLGHRQSQLIANTELSALMTLFVAKQQLITALQKIEAGIAPFHLQDPDDREWESPAARAHCAGLAAQCKELLEEVMATEQENERRMTSRRDEVARQLSSMTSGAQVRQAYERQQASSSALPVRPTASPLKS